LGPAEVSTEKIGSDTELELLKSAHLFDSFQTPKQAAARLALPGMDRAERGHQSDCNGKPQYLIIL
jgi:hypothetical protein